MVQINNAAVERYKKGLCPDCGVQLKYYGGSYCCPNCRKEWGGDVVLDRFVQVKEVSISSDSYVPKADLPPGFSWKRGELNSFQLWHETELVATFFAGEDPQKIQKVAQEHLNQKSRE